MLIDGFYVPGTNQISIASVVERDPIAIVGNSIVFRVSAGSFLGIGDIKTPAALFNHYVSLEAPSEPMLVSLPTDGLYAQTIMDECAALEEHFGNIDWVLNDPDPALGEIAPELLASRSAGPPPTATPSTLPPTLINLQNVPEAPTPSGLAGALSAVTNANAFRDMTGLAGTQANAATAFQTAASLASSFGAQAAALKLAESADKAHATQTADQKLASVQRAIDKNLISPEDAQRHASQILEGLHSAPDTNRSYRDAMTQAISKASGQPGSSIESSTNDGQFKVTLASMQVGGGTSTPATNPTPTPAPATLPNRVDGIDIYDNNSMPSAADLARLGISFVIHKSSDGAGHLDTQYEPRRNDIRSSGLIYGSFHFFRFWTGIAQQVSQAVGVVERLSPGELGPCIDFEETSWNEPKLGHANKVNPWTPKQWVDALQQYFDGIETALGRIPMIYTSWQVWHEAVENNNHPGMSDADLDPDDSLMRNYPLWVKMYYDPAATRYRDRLTRVPDELRDLPTPWLDWAFWQYSDQRPTVTTFASLDAGTDMDVSHGSIYRLRGMADLDHTAPHTSGSLTFISYAQPDGRVHLLTNLGFWTDWDLFNDNDPQPPPAAGDPTAAVIGNEQIILYRDRDGHIQALTRTIGPQPAGWTVTDLTNATSGQSAAGDPIISVIQNQIHALYWDTNDHQIHLTRSADWHAEDLTAATAGTPAASGIGMLYANGGIVSAVARAGADGKLFELPSGAAAADLTSTAHVATGSLPAATYRTVAYTGANGAARIVFRGLRGDIWQIERDTMNATNLSVTAGHAPPAAGSPSVVMSNTAHIFYRTLNDTIIEMFDDAGTWRRRMISCDAIPAGDPTAFVDSNGQTAVSFRTVDAAIHVATLIQGKWICQDTAPPQAVASAALPVVTTTA
jgi:GH25 family lysozyme M1 (1,4-beta-N-acetylmuramidase)